MSTESQGGHEHVARPWRRDEEALVRRAVALVARHGRFADLSEIITPADVIAAYPDGPHGLGGS